MFYTFKAEKPIVLIEEKQINALLRLMDDPDEEVYQTVSEKLISLGSTVIPVLENFWEQTPYPETQERVELLIHQLQFTDLKKEFINWEQTDASLLEAVLLINKYFYPDADSSQTKQLLEKMRRNIWLELNAYLTPIEEVLVLNSIVFNYYKHTTQPYNYKEADKFLLPKVLETKKGNVFSHAILLLLLSESLDLSIQFLSVPNQFVLIYTETALEIFEDDKTLKDRIKFFIDPANGKMFSHQEMDLYLKSKGLSEEPTIFRALSSKELIKVYLIELSQCFGATINNYKAEELILLANLIKL